MKQFLFLSISATAVFCFSCGTNTETKIEKIKPDFLSSNLDSTVNPSENFFMFANGGWIKKNPIPGTESRWGIGNMVDDEIYNKLRTVCEKSVTASTKNVSNEQRMIGDFYFTAMDTQNIESKGVEPLMPIIEKTNAIKSANELTEQIAYLQSINVGAVFSFYVSQDSKNSSKYALYAMQGGLGLPNRDYYLKTDERVTEIRKKYIEYIQQTLNKIGVTDAEKAAQQVFNLEKELATASRSLENLRDPYKNYNPKTTDEFQKITPSFGWTKFFTNVGITKVDTIVVGQPEFFTATEKLLKFTPLSVWKNYLNWQLVITYAEKLNKNFADADFNFYSTTLYGVKKQRPRWKRMIDDANESIGDLLGQIFVKEYFSPKAKERYSKMVDDVMLSYKEHIEKLDWMSDETKQKALKKLGTVTKKVGYPDKWKDFSSMTIGRKSYVENAININKFWVNYYLNKLGKPVDRSEWGMNPQTYNAYYNPSNNEIVLPAAIFAVAGYTDEELDDALVYGYAGASTIGHEITHGFDDEGRQFDEVGNLKAWWTKEDEEKFIKKANMYIMQFNNYVVLDSLHVNGQATLGENIADLGGIVIALDAFKKTEQYKKGEKIGGLTPIQRFFLGYSLGWLGHQTNERLANQILTDVHSPAYLRVNGPFSNIPDFYTAFNIKENSPMWRADSLRVTIW
jgi:putative endopeptidase